jgi:hypothetical protein
MIYDDYVEDVLVEDGYSGDDLQPVGNRERMLVMALLRKVRGQAVLVKSGSLDTYTTSEVADFIYIKDTFKKPDIVVKSLDIPWEYVDDRWNYGAIDKSGVFYFYDTEPVLGGEGWLGSLHYTVAGGMRISTEGIDWKKSLTSRDLF